MRRRKPLNMKVNRQGGPKLTAMEILIEHENLALAYIAADRKSYEVMTYGHCNGEPPSLQMVCVSGTPGEGLGHTSVSFPDFIGWRVFMAEMQRYSLHVLFVRESALGL